MMQPPWRLLQRNSGLFTALYPASVVNNVCLPHHRSLPDGSAWVLESFPATLEQAKVHVPSYYSLKMVL